MKVTLAVVAAVALAAFDALNPLDDFGTVTAPTSHSAWGFPTQGETKTVLDGVYTLDRARRGEQIYTSSVPSATVTSAAPEERGLV